MKTGAIIAVLAVVLVVLVVAFWIIFGGFSTTQSDTEVNTETGSNSENTQTGEVSEETGNQETSGVGSSNTQEFTVEINNSGFFPKDLEINQGDAVAWINMGSSSSWPASAMHPTHTAYPGSGIEKCIFLYAKQKGGSAMLTWPAWTTPRMCCIQMYSSRWMQTFRVLLYTSRRWLKRSMNMILY